MSRIMERDNWQNEWETISTFGSPHLNDVFYSHLYKCCYIIPVEKTNKKYIIVAYPIDTTNNTPPEKAKLLAPLYSRKEVNKKELLEIHTTINDFEETEPWYIEFIEKE